jgi:hypothetical protein
MSHQDSFDYYYFLFFLNCFLFLISHFN